METKISRQKTMLERLKKIGLVHEEEYSWASDLLDNKKGEV